MIVKPPSSLLDAPALAERLWEYWVSMLKTDFNVKPEDFPDWAQTHDDWKKAFTEAVKSQVVRTFKDYKDAVEIENALDEAFEEKTPRPTAPMHQSATLQGREPSPCYICASNGVSV